MASSGVTIKFKLADVTRKVAEEVVLRTTKKVEQVAAMKVRTDTGNLKGSIVGEVHGLEGTVTSNAPYALAQEFGMPNQPSQEKENTEPKNGLGGPYTFSPYMRPAAQFAASQEEIDRSFEAACQRYLR